MWVSIGGMPEERAPCAQATGGEVPLLATVALTPVLALVNGIQD